MPICIKSSTSCTDLTNQASTEIDNHTSEAANVKRNREQAYFNSYDFDAIASTPYITHDDIIHSDHDVADDVKKVNRNLPYSQPKTATKSNPHTQLQTYQHNHHVHVFSTTGHSLHGSNDNNNVTAFGKHSYLPHYNNSSCNSNSNSNSINKFLNHSHRASRSSISSSNNSYNSTITDKCQYNNNNNERTPAITTTVTTATTTTSITQQLDTIYASETSLTTKPTIKDNNKKNTIKEGTTVYSSSNRQTDSLTDVTATDNNSNSKSNKNGFLLPRAILKHQSVGILNTMPLAATINVSTTPPPTETAQAVIEVDIDSFKTSSTPTSSISPPLPLSAPLVTTSNQTGSSSSSLNSFGKSNEKTTKLKIIQNNDGDNVTGNNNNNNNNNNSSSSANNVMTINSSGSNAGSKTRLAAYNHQYQLHRYGHSNSPDKNTGFTSTTIKTTDSTLNHNLYSDDDYTPSNRKSFNTMKHKKILSSTSTGQHNSATIDNNTNSSNSSKNAINLPPIHEIKVKGLHQPFDQHHAIKALKNIPTTITAAADVKICRYGTGVNGLEHGSTLSHQSHYSTDKSGGGSSGYYSSNVCSTYSLMEEEEHIYSEPTATNAMTRTLNPESRNIIGVLDVRNERKKKKQNSSPNKANNDKKISNNPERHKHAVPKVGHSRHITHHDKFTSLTLPEKNSAIRVLPTTSRSQCLNAVVVVKEEEEEEENKSENNDDNANNESGDVHYQMKTNSNNIKRITATPTIETTATVLAKEEGNFGDNLKKLEHSIENLDRHLKKFQSFAPNQQQTSQEQQQQQTPHHQQQQQQQQYITNCCSAAYTTPSVHIGKKVIPPDCLLNINVNDDSLLDIDFDSFLLKHDAKSKTQPNILNPLNAEGNALNNATFLTAEQEENHLKCAKYINSCPEDAYQVDSDILVHSRGSTESEQSLNENIRISKQLKAKPAHFPQRYEDQVHFQSTRELLEDVREKIRLFTNYKNSSSPTLSFADDSPSLVAAPTTITHPLNIEQCEDYVPKELTCMIKTLKHELELYLERLNQHNEIEIRQLCTGLVKNRNILKMRRALGTRCYSSSLSNGDFRDYVTYEAIKDNEFKATAISKQQPITSLRCSISDPNFKMKRKSLAEVFSIPDAIEANTMQTTPSPVPGDKCQSNTQLQRNLSYHQSKLRKLENYHKTQHDLATEKSKTERDSAGDGTCATKHLKNLTMLSDWHRKKPSIWELYYGSNRLQQTLLGKRDSCTGDGGVNGCSGMANSHNGNNHLILAHTTNPLCYPSSRPESDFTLDLPRAEQLRLKMDKEKKFRQRCRLITTFLSLVFFLLTVMVVSLVLTRGKRMFGSMI